MKKTSFIFGLHEVVFSIFLVLNTIINRRIYGFFERVFEAEWLVSVCDLLVSIFLYLVIYLIVYFIVKFITINLKKDIIKVSGTWYHVHVKKDDNGIIPCNTLRAGVTTIKQDFCELSFVASNCSYGVDENGEVVKYDNARKNTGWKSWSVDWDGKEKLITCFKADTPVKTGGEYMHRHGIHKLNINLKTKMIYGEFADEYPSKNRGEIYFFKTETQLYDFIKDFFTENKFNVSDK